MKRYIILYVKSEWYSLNVDDFDDYSETLTASSKDTVITFQSSDLLRHLKSLSPNRPLPAIVELECFDKQMSQEGKDFRKYKKWKPIEFLKYHKIVHTDSALSRGNFKSLLESLANCYIYLQKKDDEEYERFKKIETRINCIIYAQQFKGVRINRENAESLCSQLEQKIYQAKNILQQDYQIFSPDNEREQRSYIEKREYNFIKSPLFTFKARRNDDRGCDVFYEMIRNQNDLDTLLYILARWGGDERTYPCYMGFGSITSRIILREPSLQNLRKANRSVIVPDNGMKFLYVDFSQFEAGILASLSNDDSLLKLYNSDIYSDLAAVVFGDENRRSDAKVIFYRYMYGDTSLSNVSKMYFAKFKALTKFRAQTIEEALKKGKIATIQGNARYISDSENTWILSHLVQATASLIYKNALIEVADQIPDAHFLIPMHDGTIYQIEESKYLVVKNKVEAIYKAEFKKMCPGIEPSLNCSDSF